MVNVEKIKKRCKELGKDYQSLCEPLNIKPTTLYHKLNNMRPLKLEETKIIQRELAIPDSEYASYFLNYDD